VVRQFYAWYWAASNDYRQSLAQARPLLEPSLYKQLQAAFNMEPDQGAFLDFDPFVNAQVNAKTCWVAPAKVNGDRARVPVFLTYERTKGTHGLEVSLGRTNGAWRIDNFIYSKDFKPARDAQAIEEAPVSDLFTRG